MRSIWKHILRLLRLRPGRRPVADPAFGLWGKGRIDGLEYQRRMRGEWDQPA